jgi:hypothetical protein
MDMDKLLNEVSRQREPPTMDLETQRRFDKWCKAHIQRALAEYQEQMEEALVYVINTLREEWRAEIHRELAKLKKGKADAAS